MAAVMASPAQYLHSHGVPLSAISSRRNSVASNATTESDLSAWSSASASTAHSAWSSNDSRHGSVERSSKDAMMENLGLRVAVSMQAECAAVCFENGGSVDDIKQGWLENGHFSPAVQFNVMEKLSRCVARTMIMGPASVTPKGGRASFPLDSRSAKDINEWRHYLRNAALRISKLLAQQQEASTNMDLSKTAHSADSSTLQADEGAVLPTSAAIMHDAPTVEAHIEPTSDENFLVACSIAISDAMDQLAKAGVQDANVELVAAESSSYVQVSIHVQDGIDQKSLPWPDCDGHSWDSLLQARRIRVHVLEGCGGFTAVAKSLIKGQEAADATVVAAPPYVPEGSSSGLAASFARAANQLIDRVPTMSKDEVPMNSVSESSSGIYLYSRDSDHHALTCSFHGESSILDKKMRGHARGIGELGPIIHNESGGCKDLSVIHLTKSNESAAEPRCGPARPEWSNSIREPEHFALRCKNETVMVLVPQYDKLKKETATVRLLADVHPALFSGVEATSKKMCQRAIRIVRLRTLSGRGVQCQDGWSGSRVYSRGGFIGTLWGRPSSSAAASTATSTAAAASSGSASSGAFSSADASAMNLGFQAIIAFYKLQTPPAGYIACGHNHRDDYHRSLLAAMHRECEAVTSAALVSPCFCQRCSCTDAPRTTAASFADSAAAAKAFH